MPKCSGVPAVWIRGLDFTGDGSVRDTLREPQSDLFR
jgi:F420-0:gamma-glutamyl ligase